jgi:hypothetical protein
MIDTLKFISLNQWLQFSVLVISLLALVISILAYKKASKINYSGLPEQQLVKKDIIKPILDRYKSIDVSIMLTAKRNAHNQLRLVLKNTGSVTAKDIDLIIGEPIRVIKKEELVNGISDSIDIKDSALKPRLTIIDAKMNFPIPEILPGVIYDIFAVTTMGYGKICDFPISVSWLDDRGTRHFQDEVVTI